MHLNQVLINHSRLIESSPSPSILCKPLLELVPQGWGAAAAAAEAAEAARQPLHAAKAVKHPCKIVVRLKATICTFEAFVGCLALGRCVQVKEDEVAERLAVEPVDEVRWSMVVTCGRSQTLFLASPGPHRQAPSQQSCPSYSLRTGSFPGDAPRRPSGAAGSPP